MLLGKKTAYPCAYDPTLLFDVPRFKQRESLGIDTYLPFFGKDLWTSYELSWLNEKGKPCVGIAEFHVPYDTPNLVESKSLKLYLNSLNTSQFSTKAEVEKRLSKDLSKATKGKVKVQVYEPHEFSLFQASEPEGTLLDDLDIEIDSFALSSHTLFCEEEWSKELLISHLLKSNCLVTGQPDWATIQISYSGPQINHEGLLRYLISFRDHNEFHEHCVERIFMDLMNRTSPEALTVSARYTRRGGLDINPIRSTEKNPELFNRHFRQ